MRARRTRPPSGGKSVGPGDRRARGGPPRVQQLARCPARPLGEDLRSVPQGARARPRPRRLGRLHQGDRFDERADPFRGGAAQAPTRLLVADAEMVPGGAGDRVEGVGAPDLVRRVHQRHPVGLPQELGAVRSGEQPVPPAGPFHARPYALRLPRLNRLARGAHVEEGAMALQQDAHMAAGAGGAVGIPCRVSGGAPHDAVGAQLPSLGQVGRDQGHEGVRQRGVGERARSGVDPAQAPAAHAPVPVAVAQDGAALGEGVRRVVRPDQPVADEAAAGHGQRRGLHLPAVDPVVLRGRGGGGAVDPRDGDVVGDVGCGAHGL